MPSKLGPHLMPNGEIKRWINAGARVFKCDPTQLGSSAQIPPGILVIGKLDQHEDRINLTDWKAYKSQGWTPQQTAAHRFDAQRNIYVGANKPRVDRYAANPRIDVWEDDNEVVPDNAAEAQWYAAYCIEMMKLYQSIGKKRANFNFAVGTPQGDIWPHLIPAIRHARDNGHYLALHEYMGYEADYGVGWKQIDGNRRPLRVWHGRKKSNGQPDESYPYGYAVLRYRWVYDTYLRPHGLHDTPLLITECGCDSVESVTPAGVSTGTWKEHQQHWAAEGKDPEQHYAAMLQWYDRYLREDSFVKGAAVFTVGSVGAWAHWDIAGTGVETHLLAYIAAERNTQDGTPPAPPPPPPTPQPQPGTWVRGIDISHHQAAVNWTKLKASGIGFMFIRCSNGLTQDTRVADYAPAALAAGIPYGLYHYYQPHLDPIGQSSLVATLVGRFGVDLPVVVDLEETQNIPADYQLRVLRFLQDLTERLKGIGINRQPIIYTSTGYWNGTLKAPEWGRHCDLWIAAWTNANQPHVPAPWVSWKFWQHKVTDNAVEIASYGVTSGRLDLNRWHGTAAELQAYLIPRQQGVTLQQALWETGKKGQVLHRHPTFAMEAAMVKDDFHPLGNEVRATVGGVAYVTQLGGNKQGVERVYYAPEGRWSEMRWTGVPSAAPAPPKPPPPPQPARIDLLPYLCGDGRIYIVRHPNGNEETFQTHREGNIFRQVKNAQFEELRFDDNWIWRGLDTSPGPSPSYDKQRPGHLRFYKQWEPGQQWARWCPRYMTIGQVWTGPGHQVQFYYKSDCVLSAANSGGATNKATLVAHHPAQTWNGFTVQDVIELRVAGGETMFYAKGWGLVAWSNSEGGSSAIIRTAQPGHANLVREISRCF